MSSPIRSVQSYTLPPRLAPFTQRPAPPRLPIYATYPPSAHSFTRPVLPLQHQAPPQTIHATFNTQHYPYPSYKPPSYNTHHYATNSSATSNSIASAVDNHSNNTFSGSSSSSPDNYDNMSLSLDSLPLSAPSSSFASASKYPFSLVSHLQYVAMSIKLTFLLLLPFRVLSALFNPVGDCDETFNYWEPTHYLLYGTGMQTWEYSPTYALRSYIYVGAHALLGKLFQLLLVEHYFGKIGIFFAIRLSLGVLTCLCEAFFIRAVSSEKRFGSLVGSLLLVFSCLAPGMFNAATAFLPQQFTMCALLLSFSCWLNESHGLAIFFMGVSGLIGWPFAVLLGVPMGIDILLRSGLLSCIRWGVLSAALCIIPSMCVDYLFYRKWILAPLNIAIYNSSSTHGPTLYGVEPLSYYLLNLLLNFNLVAVLAVAALALAVLVLVSSTFSVWASLRKTNAITFFKYSSPLYLWLAFMFRMPHKEERFLFVVYPLLMLAAAYFLGEVHSFVDRLTRVPAKGHAVRGGSCFSALVKFLYGLLVVAMLVLYLSLSLSRNVAVVHNYSAPLSVYSKLYAMESPSASAPSTARAAPASVPTKLSKLSTPRATSQGEDLESAHSPRDIAVCVGKEWYRFPSHFFVPFPNQQTPAYAGIANGNRAPNMTLQYLYAPSGLLPKHFEPYPLGTSIIPSDMNDENRQELSRYVHVSACDYIVDLELPEQKEHYWAEEQDQWQVVYSEPFLDANRSPSLTRALFIPFYSTSRNAYGSYQLVKRVHPRSHTPKAFDVSQVRPAAPNVDQHEQLQSPEQQRDQAQEQHQQQGGQHQHQPEQQHQQQGGQQHQQQGGQQHQQQQQQHLQPQSQPAESHSQQPQTQPAEPEPLHHIHEHEIQWEVHHDQHQPAPAPTPQIQHPHSQQAQHQFISPEQHSQVYPKHDSPPIVWSDAPAPTPAPQQAEQPSTESIVAEPQGFIEPAHVVWHYVPEEQAKQAKPLDAHHYRGQVPIPPVAPSWQQPVQQPAPPTPNSQPNFQQFQPQAQDQHWKQHNNS